VQFIASPSTLSFGQLVAARCGFVVRHPSFGQDGRLADTPRAIQRWLRPGSCRTVRGRAPRLAGLRPPPERRSCGPAILVACCGLTSHSSRTRFVASLRPLVAAIIPGHSHRVAGRLNSGVMRPSAFVLRGRAAIGSWVCCPAPGSWALAGRRASGRQWTFRAGAPAGRSSARVPSSLLAAHRTGSRGGARGSSAFGWHKRRRGSASGALTRPVARVSDTLPHNKSFKPKPLRGSA
jgi:hypothetical protein